MDTTSWYKKLPLKSTIRTKLILGFLVVMALGGLVFGLGYLGLSAAGRSTTLILNQVEQKDAVGELEKLIREERQEYLLFALTGNGQSLQRARDIGAEVAAVIGEIRQTLPVSEQNGLERVVSAHAAFVDSNERMAQLYGAGDAASGRELLATIEDDAARLRQAMAGIEATAVGTMSAIVADAAATRRTILIAIIAAAVTSTLISLMVSLVLSGGISRKARHLADAAHSIAAGDLSPVIDVRGRDEMGDLARTFASMITYLREMAEAADQIAVGDLTGSITPKNEKDVLGRAMSTMKQSVEQLLGVIQGTAAQVIQGDLNYRAEAGAFQGEYANLVHGFNDTVAAVVGFIDNVPAPFMVIDPERNVRFLNRAGADVVGETAVSAVGRKCFDLFRTDDCHNGQCATLQAMRRGSLMTAETAAAPNGKQLEIAYTGVPILGAKRQILGAFEVMTDQTTIKQTSRLTQKIADFQTEEVRKLEESLGWLSGGDLTFTHIVQVADTDTAETRAAFAGIAAALNQSVEGLRGMAVEMRDGSMNITTATAEILASSSQMASTTQQQATAVHQIVSTVEEIKASAAQVAQRAHRVADAAAEASQAARRGTAAADETMHGMEAIRSQVESIAENILSLSEQMQQIGKIIDTVTDIADQSNILALNAAIEAAQAGEAGKGFRVVADEVRSLAEQSRQAAGQVKIILGDIQKATNLAVMATEQGTKGVDAGTAMVNRTAQTIRELAGTVDESAQAAQQIVAGVQQQTVGLDQIAIGMDDINSATRQTADGSQQAERAAQDLNGLAAQLLQVVEQYRLPVTVNES